MSLLQYRASQLPVPQLTMTVSTCVLLCTKKLCSRVFTSTTVDCVSFMHPNGGTHRADLRRVWGLGYISLCVALEGAQSGERPKQSRGQERWQVAGMGEVASGRQCGEAACDGDAEWGQEGPRPFCAAPQGPPKHGPWSGCLKEQLWAHV